MGRPASRFAWKLEALSKIMALHLHRVCRQLRSELGRYFIFKHNTFAMVEPQLFSYLLDSFTNKQKAMIEIIKMDVTESKSLLEWIDSSYFPLRCHNFPPNLKRMVMRDLSGMDAPQREDLISAVSAIPAYKAWKLEIESIC